MAKSNDKVTNLLGEFADIMPPTDAAPPILGPRTRAALMDWLTELRCQSDLKEVGLKPRRTALLFGPPGCGKTTFAHHFAARLGLPLAVVRSESIISKWVGATGENIGKLFDALAATEGEVVIFFDEIDSIGTKRMADQGASVERSSSLTVLLRRIEAFNGICFGATNRHEDLDTALWRRFDMQIEISLPGDEERFAILRQYGMPFDMPDHDIDTLVELTAGASPALLRNLMEGVKRQLVMGAKLNRLSSSAAEAYMQSAAAVAPPPELQPVPRLWGASDGRLRDQMATMKWPLERAE